eukprot:COSAG05_NODE_477_length_9434_cov_1.772319_2_plen_428_part_00
MSAAEKHGTAVLEQLSAPESASGSGPPPVPAAVSHLAQLSSSAAQTAEATTSSVVTSLPSALTNPAPPARLGGIGLSSRSSTLSLALMRRDWGNAESLVTKEAAQQRDLLQRTPLAAAISMQAPPNIIDALLKVFPEAAREKDPFGDTPLMVALKQNTSGKDPRTALQVLASYPEAAAEPGSLGDLPLDHVLQHGANKELVQKLLDANPAAAREKNKGLGQLPLMVALRRNVDWEVIALIVKAYPEAAREADLFGYLPLQVAMNHYSQRKDLIELLKSHTPSEHCEAVLNRPHLTFPMAGGTPMMTEKPQQSQAEATSRVEDLLSRDLRSMPSSLKAEPASLAAQEAGARVDEKIQQLKVSQQNVLNERSLTSKNALAGSRNSPGSMNPSMLSFKSSFDTKSTFEPAGSKASSQPASAATPAPAPEV